MSIIKDDVICTNRSGSIEYRILTKDRIEDAISIQQRSMQQECVAIGVGMYEEPSAPEQMQLVFREIIRDGCTILAVDVDTDKTVAVCFNKLHCYPDNGNDDFGAFIDRNIKCESCLNLIDFIEKVESSVNIFERYNVKSAMELFYVGTEPECQNRGIGKEIIEASLRLGREMRVGRKVRPAEKILAEQVYPAVAFGVFTSNISQRIAQTMKFEELAELHYEDYLYKGKRMSDRIGDVHRTVKLMARWI